MIGSVGQAGVVAQQMQEGDRIARQCAAFHHHRTQWRAARQIGGELGGEPGSVVHCDDLGAPVANGRLHAGCLFAAGQYRHPHRRLEMFCGCSGLCGLQRKRQLEPECRAFAFAAVQTNLPAQRFHQLFGNGGAQPAAAIAAGNGRIGLGEAVENTRLRGFRNTDAGIDDLEAQTLRTALPDRADIDVDPAMLGKLDGIADQVDQDLSQVARIAMQMKWRLRRDVGSQHQTLALSLPFHHRDGAVDQAVQVEILFAGVDTAGLDARDIEHVVDQFQQGVGRCANDLGKFLLIPCRASFPSAGRQRR